MDESESHREHEKPPFFYHASPNRDIEKLEPRAITVRDEKEGPVLFGTPDKGLASIFMIGHDDSWTASGQINGRLYFLFSDRDKLVENDKGGSLYILPAESFSQNEDPGEHMSEWVSREIVTPIEKTDYESGLLAMEENGVEVFGVDEQTLRKFQTAEPEEKERMIEQFKVNEVELRRSGRPVEGKVVDEKK